MPELPLLIQGLGRRWEAGRVRWSCKVQDATPRGGTSRAEGRGCYSILVDQHPSPYAIASKSILLTQAQMPSIVLLGVPQSPEPWP